SPGGMGAHRAFDRRLSGEYLHVSTPGIVSGVASRLVASTAPSGGVDPLGLGLYSSVTNTTARVGSRESMMPLTTLCGMNAAFAVALMGMVASVAGEDDPFTKREAPRVVGRWDFKVHGTDGDHPSWLEVRESGYRTLVGSFVGQFGSARPI